MRVGDRVERADESRVGWKDHYGTVIGFHADANGGGLRSGWRVQWDMGGLGVYAERELREAGG